MEKNIINRKNIILLLCTSLILLFIINILSSNISRDIKSYFNGTSRGKTVKKYLRYGSYDIWEKFNVEYRYNFHVLKEEEDRDKSIGFFIRMNLSKFPGGNITKEFLETIMRNDINEVNRNNAEFVDMFRKEISLDGNYAIVAGYKFEGNEIAELCYIRNANQIIKLKADSLTPYFLNGKHIWEAFYKSYRKDLSQNYKTDFGSFMITEYCNERSNIHYSIGEIGNYVIEINYIDTKDKEEVKRNDFDTIKKELSQTLTSKLKLADKKKLVVDSKNADYEEIDLVEDRDNMVFIRKRATFLILDDLNPGLEIKISANDAKIFELYRGEMETMLSSLKFDK
jgi:hypothetical protein